MVSEQPQSEQESETIDRHVRLREDQIKSITISAKEEKRSWIMQLHYIIDSYFDKDI